MYIDGHWERYGAGATGVGWELGLIGLHLHMAGASSRESVDPKAFEAWSMSPEGQGYIRESGAAWGAAEAAGGEDADVAKNRSARTVAFYTGQAEPD